MNNTKINGHRFENKDLPLYLMAGGFGIWRAWKKAGLEKAIATYDLFVRELPENRNFLVFTGLEEAMNDIQNWKFTNEDIDTLLKYKVIDGEMAKELVDFKFDITIEAMKEGTIFFPYEPVMKITGPLYQLELLYLYLLTVVSSNTIFSSKCARVVLASKDKKYVLAGTRAQSFESCFKCMRAMYICGGYPSPSQLSFWNKYGLDPKKAFIGITHAFIKSFKEEKEAMGTFAETLKESEVPILVDTYNYEKGVVNFIEVAKKMKKAYGKVPIVLYIDSGELGERAKYARRKLDENNLKEVKILLSGNLDEYNVSKLVNKKVPADMFFGVTQVVNSVDAPSLEVVYKLAELSTTEGKREAMKLTPGKKSYPGKKQVFRIKNKNGKWIRDIIGLENEEIRGEKLLERLMENGRLIKDLPTLDESREYMKEQLKELPEYLKSLTKTSYQIELSSNLQKMVDEFQKKHR